MERNIAKEKGMRWIFLGIDFETRMCEGLTGHVRVHLGLSCL